jgi:hypothetical protein
MAKAGKILALIGAILTILGTFFFTLFQSIPGEYIYGAGGMFNIDDIFIYGTSGAPDAWISWIIGPILIIYLISGFIQLLGMKSRAASIIGAILPLVVAIFITLAMLDIVVPHTIVYLVSLSAPPIVPNFIPIAFEYSFMNFGFGFILIALGGLLSLVSGFISRN